jgi:Ras-related GTP-binding protein A/B
MENYLKNQRDHIFKNVEVLIYVFDIESSEREKDVQYFESSLDALRTNSPDAKIFCLIHKMDVILAEDERKRVFEERQAELQKMSAPLDLTCFRTSIWDESLYKAWSSIVHSLVPNRIQIERGLLKLCEICDADEIVLFERATFLVISHASAKSHSDVHRFEKISNIVKQFKLSCQNSHAQFFSLETKNSSFSAFIESFTYTTYIMVVTSDSKIQSGGTLMNVETARSFFEKLVQS